MKKDNYWHEETAHLTYGREGRFLEIEERPITAILLEKIGGWFMSDATFHIFCCRQPEWSYRIRWGEADEDGWTEQSLGHLMFRVGQAASGGWGAWKKTRRIAAIPVSIEWIKDHYPNLDEFPWTKDKDE